MNGEKIHFFGQRTNLPSILSRKINDDPQEKYLNGDGSRYWERNCPNIAKPDIVFQAPTPMSPASQSKLP